VERPITTHAVAVVAAVVSGRTAAKVTMIATVVMAKTAITLAAMKVIMTSTAIMSAPPVISVSCGRGELACCSQHHGRNYYGCSNCLANTPHDRSLRNVASRLMPRSKRRLVLHLIE